MHYDIVSMGALLVEIMRKERDRPLCEPADFAGPYPSGDTPIFIGQAARLGNRCLFLGVVGEDDFGRCVLGRLHVTGFSLVGSESTKHAFYKALKVIPDHVKVIFDPNIRPEILSVEQIRSLYETGLFANAVGAMSVRRMGPMEGQPWRDEVEAFIARNSVKRA